MYIKIKFSFSKNQANSYEVIILARRFVSYLLLQNIIVKIKNI